MSVSRTSMEFWLNDERQVLSDVRAGDTLLDFIRLQARLTGTKEGCAEGDCGACTVLVGQLHQGELRYQPVNACIRLLASLHRCHVVTVEYLNRDGMLHPIQQAMVEAHASQCGFCTPGFVMSLYALWLSNPAPTQAQIETALQGNLCRCTGYRPIVEAAMAAAAHRDLDQDQLSVQHQNMARTLAEIATERVVLEADGSRSILPADEADLLACLADHPNATLVAGATDVGLWVTKFMRDIAPAIHVSHLAELQRIEISDDQISIGAAVSYSDCGSLIAGEWPFLQPFWERIGGWQVRNMGTIGGNIANGSPIGDTPPLLIALGARLLLNGPDGEREMPLEDFFIDYGKQDRRPNEYVKAIRIPRLADAEQAAAYKISKRRDEDISSVCLGSKLQMSGATVADIRLAYGGMAATPKRAAGAEAVLRGAVLNDASISAAQRALADDFSPISDQRASAAYRMAVAQNLLARLLPSAGGAQ